MQARAEESKNNILREVDAGTLAIETRIEEVISFTSLVAIVLVMVLLILLAAFCQDWIVFLAMLAYIIVMSFLYLAFSRAYTRKRLDSARRSFNNFIASENALIILNGAAEAYNAA